MGSTNDGLGSIAETHPVWAANYSATDDAVGNATPSG